MLFLVEKVGGKLRAGKELQPGIEKIKELAMVPLDRLQDYGFPPKFGQLAKANFPERGSYKGNFKDFYGEW